MDSINGLPLHPLIVHIPVAMLPLAFLGVAVMCIKRAWYERYRWAVLVVGGIGTLGAILAASTGESLESDVRRTEGAAAIHGIHEHAEAGDLARTVAIVFFIALAAWVLIPWYLDRRHAHQQTGSEGEGAVGHSHRHSKLARSALMVTTAVLATASMATIYRAGHSGATSVWREQIESGPSDGDG
jgi:uncharacterized membrane protein